MDYNHVCTLFDVGQSEDELINSSSTRSMVESVEEQNLRSMDGRTDVWEPTDSRQSTSGMHFESSSGMHSAENWDRTDQCLPTHSRQSSFGMRSIARNTDDGIEDWLPFDSSGMRNERNRDDRADERVPAESSLGMVFSARNRHDRDDNCVPVGSRSLSQMMHSTSTRTNGEDRTDEGMPPIQQPTRNHSNNKDTVPRPTAVSES